MSPIQASGRQRTPAKSTGHSAKHCTGQHDWPNAQTSTVRCGWRWMAPSGYKMIDTPGITTIWSTIIGLIGDSYCSSWAVIILTVHEAVRVAQMCNGYSYKKSLAGWPEIMHFKNKSSPLYSNLFFSPCCIPYRTYFKSYGIRRNLYGVCQ